MHHWAARRALEGWWTSPVIVALFGLLYVILYVWGLYVCSKMGSYRTRNTNRLLRMYLTVGYIAFSGVVFFLPFHMRFVCNWATISMALTFLLQTALAIYGEFIPFSMLDEL